MRFESKEQIDNAWNELFNEYVPSSGPAKTAYGEIIRAINRIVYRWQNDGDLFFADYGIESCGHSAYYILKAVEPYEYNAGLESLRRCLHSAANDMDITDYKTLHSERGRNEQKYYTDLLTDIRADFMCMSEQDKQDLLDLPAGDSDKYSQAAKEYWGI